MRYTLIFFLLIFGLLGCNKYDSQIKLIFDEEELKTQDVIVNFLDSVIIDYTGTKNLKKAYPIYFDSCKRAAAESGEAIFFGIDDMDIFLKSLNQNHLKEYYNIVDTITIRYPKSHHKSGESKIITDAYQKTVNFYGKFIDLLEILKEESIFIEDYYESIIAAGDFTAGNIHSVLSYCSEYKLNNKYHRLIIAITIFSLDRDYYESAANTKIKGH